MQGDFAALLPRRLTRLSTAQRQALAATLVSLIGWSVWNGFRTFDHPWGDLSRGAFTDHFSHMNTARVFPHMGRDIWRVPIDAKFRRLTSEELAQTPSDVRLGATSTGGVFFVPGWPADKPLVINWTNKTRMYPPGNMLLVAPIAALYHYTSLSLTGACRILLGWFIILAHVALFCFFLTYFEGKGSGIDWLVCFIVYSQIIYWTLEGFYDAVAIVPMFLCARYLGRRRGLAAVVAYCMAAMLHFRVFFQGPWALCAVWIMVRDKFWQRLQLRDAIPIAVAVLCAGISLYVFWLDWASLSRVTVNNPLLSTSGLQNKALIWNFKVVLLVCALALLAARAWFDLFSIAWLALVIFELREVYYWHLLISLSWITAPVRRPMVRGVRVAFLLYAMATLFSDSVVPSWLQMLYHAN